MNPATPQREQFLDGHFLTKENVVMKTAHINQKYFNTK